jgi:hypothetical protein
MINSSHIIGRLTLVFVSDLVEQLTLQMINTPMAGAAFNMMKVIRRMRESILRILNELFEKLIRKYQIRTKYYQT